MMPLFPHPSLFLNTPFPDEPITHFCRCFLYLCSSLLVTCQEFQVFLPISYNFETYVVRPVLLDPSLACVVILENENLIILIFSVTKPKTEPLSTYISYPVRSGRWAPTWRVDCWAAWPSSTLLFLFSQTPFS